MNLISLPSKALLCALAACACSAMGAEKQVAPIYLANQNPFVQIFGLPKSEPGTITPKGKLDMGFLYYVSNNAIQSDTSNGESIIWDGETAQYTLRARYGVSEKLEVGVDLPFVDHSGGYLDSLIRHFHSTFSMPNDRQEQFGKNQLHYQLKGDGDTRYEMQDRQNGLGDIRFSAAIPLMEKTSTSQRFLALRSLLKLPTGDSDGLLGSGGTDVATGLAYTDYKLLAGINTVLTANLGMLYMGNTKVLRDIQKHFAGYGGVSAAWLATKHLEFKLQMDMHSALYDSDLSQLGSSLQILAGGTAHLPGDVLLDLGISQQLTTDATPDVGFYLFIHHLF